jgi:hypothetical protein
VSAAPGETGALRAEHDDLARKLATRRSIDHVRRGAWAAFLLVITGGLAGKLAWDRWASTHPRAFKGPPVLVHLALAAALVCLALAASAFVRARRLMRQEDRDFERLRALRRELGLES